AAACAPAPAPPVPLYFVSVKLAAPVEIVACQPRARCVMTVPAGAAAILGARGPVAAGGPGKELGHLEGLPAVEHVVDRARELVGEDRERFPLAMLVREPGHVPLRGGILAQAEHGRFGERPLQMGVADL